MGHRGHPLNGRQRKAAGLIILAVLFAGVFCGARGGGDPEQQPENDTADPHVGSVAAVVPQGTYLATELPEVEPSHYIEAAPLPEYEVVAQEPVVSTPYTPPVYNSGVEQWRSLVASIMPAETVDRWLRVMACESGGNPNATGAAGERGLFQVHPLYHYDATWDPEGNVRAAYRISGGGYDFGPWSCKGY